MGHIDKKVSMVASKLIIYVLSHKDLSSKASVKI